MSILSLPKLAFQQNLGVSDDFIGATILGKIYFWPEDNLYPIQVIFYYAISGQSVMDPLIKSSKKTKYLYKMRQVDYGRFHPNIKNL
jgi:hypothetical protein